MALSPTEGRAVITLLSPGVVLPITGKLLSNHKHSSLGKVEEACIASQQTGQLHPSLTEDDRTATWAPQLQTVDPVIPSLGRRFSNQLKRKSLVHSRLCINGRSKNEIIGTIKTAMEEGTWSRQKNVIYKASSYLHY